MRFLRISIICPLPSFFIGEVVLSEYIYLFTFVSCLTDVSLFIWVLSAMFCLSNWYIKQELCRSTSVQTRDDILTFLFWGLWFSCSQILLNYLVFQSFDYDLTWWRFIQKRVVRTKFDIYLFNDNYIAVILLLKYWLQYIYMYISFCPALIVFREIIHVFSQNVFRYFLIPFYLLKRAVLLAFLTIN